MLDIATLYKYNHIQVEVTSRCNLRCRTCLYYHFESQWVPQDISEAVFQQICEVAPACRSIHLQGWGESLLRSDCTTLIRNFKKRGPKISLGTNGTIMNRDIATALIKSGLDSMTFSLAGISSVQQDPLRGKGSFSKTIQSIKIFSAVREQHGKPTVLVNYLLTPDSLKSLPSAVSLCSRIGVDILKPTHMVHIATHFQEKLITYPLKPAYRWVVFRSRMAVIWSDVILLMPSLRENLVPVCEKNPVENLFVGADGSVSPCAYLNPPLSGGFPRIFKGQKVPSSRLIMGNLNQSQLDDIWDRPAYQRFRKAFQDRIGVYHQLMRGITPDFEGLDRLQKTSERLSDFFATRYLAPEPCRVCPHLHGL